MHAERAASLLSSETPSPSDELLRLRLAVEASGEIVFMTDEDGVISYVNPEFVRVYGYEAAEVVGQTTPRVLRSGSTSAEEYASFWRELVANRVARGEFTNRTKSGALVQIEGSANPILDGDQRVGFLAVQRDVTNRKAMEAALRESERRYRTLAEAAHDAIFIVNRAGVVEYANAASAEQFGVRLDSATGRRLHDLFPAAAADAMWADLSAVFATRQKQYFERCLAIGERDLWLGTWLAPLSDDGGELPAVMGVARDIGERKRLEKQFLQAQKMEAIGQLTGGIAHDFNNLLTAILGYSELLLGRADLPPDASGDLEQIKKAGERASRLTRQLLTFSRKQVTAPRVLDLNDVVNDLQKMLGRVINEDIRLELSLEPDLHRVKADPGQIEQLIVNLAVNARDAMPQGGLLQIATANVALDAAAAREHEGAAAGRYVSLSVRDNGCGMSPEVLAHVFEPFFTTKPAGKGTGLGLATVYGIVKQSGGYLTVASTPWKGTEITACLPVADEAAAAALAPAAPATTLNGRETILLVEDESGLRALMQRTLKQYGYTVLDAANVTEAMAFAEGHPAPIDLLLTDVVMPGLCGPDLAQRVVRLHPAIKVLYVSGFANVAAGGTLSRRALLLPKPFTPQILAATVRGCLNAPAPATGEIARA